MKQRRLRMTTLHWLESNREKSIIDNGKKTQFNNTIALFGILCVPTLFLPTLFIDNGQFYKERSLSLKLYENYDGFDQMVLFL